MKASTPQYLRSLQLAVLKTADLTLANSADSALLQELILTSTGSAIGLLALQRFYGLAPARFGPSLYTLNVLASYCSYPSWSAFCAGNSGATGL